jgi:ATP-binding cassette subfamily C protein
MFHFWGRDWNARTTIRPSTKTRDFEFDRRSPKGIASPIDPPAPVGLVKLPGSDPASPIANAFRACREHFVAAAIFSFLINLLYLAPPIYMLQVYDRVVATGGKLTLLFITLALGIALLALAALDAIRARLLLRASLRLDSIIAPRLLRRVIAANGGGEVQAIRDFDAVRQMVGTPVLAALFDAPWAPIYIIVAFLLHFWIGVLALVAGAMLLALAWLNQKRTRRANEMAADAMAKANAAAQTLSLNNQTIRALGMSGRMVDRQLLQRRVGLESFAEAQFAGSRFAASSRFFRLFVQSVALGLGALLAIEGYISGGAIIAASILLGRALQPVEALISGWPALNAGRTALVRLGEILGSAEHERIPTRLPEPQGRLTVENVGARGPDGKPVLYGISFELAPGELLGVVGPSGAGKTMLAKVVAGAMMPDAGAVRIDGARFADWDPDDLGRNIGYLPQEPSLFEGTIKENVARFESGESVDERAVEAAKRAGAHDLILRLPSGYDTRLGPLGKGLSAGQAQRIALARAFYGDPVLLILDEPNAFLDAEGEEALMRSIEDALTRKRSVMLIAHRRAVLDKADRLLVLEGGQPRLLGPASDVAARLVPPSARSA